MSSVHIFLFRIHYCIKLPLSEKPKCVQSFDFRVYSHGQPLFSNIHSAFIENQYRNRLLIIILRYCKATSFETNLWKFSISKQFDPTFRKHVNNVPTKMTHRFLTKKNISFEMLKYFEDGTNSVYQ